MVRCGCVPTRGERRLALVHAFEDEVAEHPALQGRIELRCVRLRFGVDGSPSLSYERVAELFNDEGIPRTPDPLNAFWTCERVRMLEISVFSAYPELKRLSKDRAEFDRETRELFQQARPPAAKPDPT